MAFSILDYLNSTGASQALGAAQGMANSSYAVQPGSIAPQKAPSFGASLLHSVESIPSAAAHLIGDGVMGAAHLGQDVGMNLAHGGGFLDRNGGAQGALDARNQQLDKQQNNLIKSFKSGQISRQQYTTQLRQLQTAGQQESNQAHAVANMQRAGYGKVAGDAAQAGGLALTLASGGLAAPETAAVDGGLGLATKLAATKAGLTGEQLAANSAASGVKAAASAVGSQAAALGSKALNAAGEGLGVGKTVAGAGNIPRLAVSGAGKLVRNALVTQPVLGIPASTVQDAKKGDIGGVALNVGALAAPAIVKGVKAVAELAPVAKEALFGKQGFFDAVKQAGGPDFLAHLDNLSGSQQQKATDLLRKVQQYNLDQFNGDAKAAGRHFSQYLESQGESGANMTEPQAMQHLSNWVKANKQFNADFKAGRLAGSPGGEPITSLKAGQTIIAGRFNQNDAQTLKAALENVPVASRNEVLNHMAQEGADWSKNQFVRDQVYEAAQHEDFGKALDSNLQSMRSLARTNTLNPTPIRTLSSAEIKAAEEAHKAHPDLFKSPDELNAEFGPTPHITTKPLMSKQGYFPTISNNARASFKDVADTAPIERGKAGVPALNAIAGTLSKMGLSPSAVDNSVIRGALNKSLQAEMDARGIPGKAQSLLAQLGTVNKTGALDARNLSKGDILGALGSGYSGKEGDVQAAVKSAYAKLPTSLIGAGPKALNQAIAKVPGLASYLRAQSVGRYSANPFFAVKQYIKSGLVAGVEGARPGISPTQDDMKALQDAGLLAQRGSRFGGDATLAGSVGAGQGQKLLAKPMRQLLGNLAASIAQKNGMTVREVLSEDTPLARQMKSSLSLVTSYGKGGYLNSPLAKTLNLIVFPSRFDTKIAMEAGKAFAKASPMTQIAVATGLANAHNFLNSPEGQQWQKDNGALIGLMTNFTPLGTLNNFSNFISKGGHLGDLGELGGLPVGVLAQILQSSGVNLGEFGSSQQNNPQTGQPYANAVGTDAKGRLQLGLTDLINSLYTFPGKNAGLGSKTSVTQAVIPSLKPAAKDEQYRYQNGQPAPATLRKNQNPAPGLTNPVRNIPGTVPHISAPSTSGFSSGMSKIAKAPKRKVYAIPAGQPL